MNVRNDTGFRTFLVGTGGVGLLTRVKLSSGTIVTAGAGEDAIGIVLETKAAGAYAAVKLWSAPGTFICASAGAITSGAAIYGAASGAIDDAVSGNKIGTALEAASGSGEYIEFLPAGVGDLFDVQAHIADPASAAALTQDTVTDNSGGAASTTIAAIGATYAQAEVANAIASILAQLAKIKTDVAAVRTGSEANNTAIDSINAALAASGITLAS